MLLAHHKPPWLVVGFAATHIIQDSSQQACIIFVDEEYELKGANLNRGNHTFVWLNPNKQACMHLYGLKGIS